MDNEDRTKEELIQELTEMKKLVDVLEKKASEHELVDKALKDSEELLRLILTLSTNFIILSPDEIDDGINDVLKAIGSFAGVDRSYVFQFDKNGIEMNNTHEWCANGISPMIVGLQHMPTNDLPWFCEKIKNFEVIHIPDITELPFEAIAEKKEFMRESIQSLVAVPIVSGYTIIGFLGFDSVSTKKKWSEDTISLLKNVGEIFAYALTRKHMMEALHDSESKYKTLFEHANDAIMLIKEKKYIDCNTKTLKIFGCAREQIIGQSPSLFSPDFQPDGSESSKKAIEKLTDVLNGSAQHFDWKHRRYDGTIFDAEVSLNRIVFGGETFIQAIVRDVTERKMAEELFRTLANSSSAGVYIVQDGKFKFVNPCFQQITGYNENEILGRDSLTFVIEADREAVKDNASKMLQGGQSSAFEVRVFAKAEETRWILVTVTSIQYKGKQAVLGNFIDVTDRKKMEMLLKESEERYRILTERSLVGVYLVQDNVFRYVNPAFANIHGYKPFEMIGKLGPMDFIVPTDREKAEESIRKRRTGGTDGTLLELGIVRKDGEIRKVEIYGSRAIYNGRPAELGTLLDVTEKKQLEEQLHNMSMKDELTKLYNRRGFFIISEQQIKIANRTKNEVLCFFIDIDGMKWINDTLGHKEGDEALIMTANILSKTFREADIIGRIGGDEFAVLAVGTNETCSELLVRRLHEHIDRYNIQTNKPYKLSLSIGVAIYDPNNPQSVDDLMSTADTLMYKEKKEKYLEQGLAR
ncbi:MAG: PAS domain S-box protein [Proteobacteria bacterium]|nr:PAS domain S-box protein [Pseudomonadota bacterium]